jgi:hypothetical protein
MLFAKALQLGDPSVGFFSMVAQLSDFLHGFVKISSQNMGQLHLVGKVLVTIMTFGKQHHNQHLHGLSSGSSGTRNAPLVVLIVMQHSQGFTCSISNSSLECPPWSGSLDRLVNMADTIGHRLLIYDHPYVLEIGVPSHQPWGFDEERGLTITQRLKQHP